MSVDRFPSPCVSKLKEELRDDMIKMPATASAVVAWQHCEENSTIGLVLGSDPKPIQVLLISESFICDLARALHCFE